VKTSRKVTQKKKVALYVAGDHNILFPAIVALVSFQSNNRNMFDCFICFDGKSLTSTASTKLKSHGIKFIDAAQVKGHGEAMKIKKMSENVWPVEVNLNWCLPEHFASLGYKYSLKVDYDTLCVGPVDGLTNYFNDKLLFSALKTGADPKVPTNALSALKKTLGWEKSREYGINSGIVTFNNHLCVEANFFEKYVAATEILTQECPKLFAVEQVALALIAANVGNQFILLDKQYHNRSFAVLHQTDGQPNAAILHYASRPKPWQSLTIVDIQSILKRDYTMMFFYRDIWREAAKQVEGYQSFVEPDRLGSLQMPLLGTFIVRHKHAVAEKKPDPVANEKTQDDAIYARRVSISKKISSELDWTVKYGPFKGLKLSQQTWWSRASRGLMFMGIYEQEVLQRLSALPATYDKFIDVGAADGYYAVGSVVSGQFKKCFAYEVSEKGQEAVRRNATLNDVQSKVTVHGLANGESIKAVVGDSSSEFVVLVDIEGAEFDFLTVEMFKTLENSVIIVENHEFFFKDGVKKREALLERAEKTHYIESFKTGARDLSKYSELTSLSDTDRWLFCSEGRKELMSWYQFIPKLNVSYSRLSAKSSDAGSEGTINTCTSAEKRAGVFSTDGDVVDQNTSRAEKVFTEIFQTNAWRNRESRSGSGSTLKYTENLRRELPVLFQKFEISSVLDAPCGDFNWMKEFLKTTSVKYLGGDIVPELVEKNNSLYANNSVAFVNMDVTRDYLGNSDLMICRDCLFHLPEEMILTFFQNFCNSKVKYLLTTSHTTGNDFENRDIKVGSFRKIDLTKPPYNLSKQYLFEIDDWIGGYAERKMLLWSRDQIASSMRS
jgi:lipopolysaccharide biosynthesis glycosyltransferase